MPRCVRCDTTIVGDRAEGNCNDWIIFYLVRRHPNHLIYGEFGNPLCNSEDTNQLVPLRLDGSMAGCEFDFYYLGLCPRCKLSEAQRKNINREEVEPYEG